MLLTQKAEKNALPVPKFSIEYLKKNQSEVFSSYFLNSFERKNIKLSML